MTHAGKKLSIRRLCLSQSEIGCQGNIMESRDEAKAAKREQKKDEKRQKRKQKKNALIITHDKIEFWTTQKQFWQWVRDGKVVKASDFPLCGNFVRADEEKMVVLSNTVLNLACPNHLKEALFQKRMARRY